MSLFLSNFRKLLQSSDKTQTEICADLKIRTQKLSNWKTGYCEPNFDDMIMLADYFGVTTDYLLGRTDDDSIVFSKNAPAPLPADQQELNILFQSLAPGYRTQVLEYARYMAERSGVNLKNTKKRG